MGGWGDGDPRPHRGTSEHLLALVFDAMSDEMAFINSDRNGGDLPLMNDDIVQFSGLKDAELRDEARVLIDEAVELISPDDARSQRIERCFAKYHRAG